MSDAINTARDASGRLTFEIAAFDSRRYPKMCRRIAHRFALRPASELVIGLDAMFRDYTDGTHTIGLEWDIWSGLIVVAKQPEAEPLVNSIADYVSRTERSRIRRVVDDLVVAICGT